MPQEVIYATVAVPLYNMGNIAGLCFAGLMAQHTRYRWELIVCEEQNDDMFGEERLRQYKFPNCCDVIYIPLKERESLSIKWRIIALRARGKCFLLQAGDDYSHPKRIENTVDVFMRGYTYYDEQRAYFYSFVHKKTIIFDPHPMNPHPCRVNIAWQTKIIKHLPIAHKSGCVDHWIYDSLKTKGVIRKFRDKKIHLGVFTFGHNKISRTGKYFEHPHQPFRKSSIDIRKYIKELMLYEHTDNNDRI
jgi:glycosyltransferase involved in cell wall biosynthesis